MKAVQTPRVVRGKAPKTKLTEANYRKKALSYLIRDFGNRCAYCLDPSEFRHSSLNHVDHFDCELTGKKRHRYENLMLACVTCNFCKRDKPLRNPFEKTQRLLNCTEETEFPKHIQEGSNGQWNALTPEGHYHLQVIGLTERSHENKRRARRENAEQIRSLLKNAIQCQSGNPAAVIREVIAVTRGILELLEGFPPLVTPNGVMSIREWLSQEGIAIDKLVPRTNPPIPAQ
jgi:hypothetical protein